MPFLLLAASRIIAAMLDLIDISIKYIQHPNRRDYLKMGLGIASRNKVFRRYWQAHLDFSASFVSDAARIVSGRQATILGAGRLLDVDLGALLESFEVVNLVDADVGVMPKWKDAIRTYGKDRIIPHYLEVTGLIDRWSDKLEKLLPKTGLNQSNLIEALTLVTTLGITDEIIPRSDLVVSLNLLSQIPLFWRDRVYAQVRKSKLESSVDLDAALIESMTQLQLKHLRDLSKCARKGVALLTDTDFLYYQKGGNNWSDHPALQDEIFETLRRNELGDFKLEKSDSWWWHLVPQNLDCGEFGEIHRVEARLYM